MVFTVFSIFRIFRIGIIAICFLFFCVRFIEAAVLCIFHIGILSGRIRFFFHRKVFFLFFLCTGCLCPGSSGRIAGIRSGVFTAKPGKYKDQDYNQDYQGQFAFFLFHFASSSGKNRIHLTSRCMCGAAVMSNISFRGPALYANTGDWRP